MKVLDPPSYWQKDNQPPTQGEPCCSIPPATRLATNIENGFPDGCKRVDISALPTLERWSCLKSLLRWMVACSLARLRTFASALSTGTGICKWKHTGAQGRATQIKINENCQTKMRRKLRVQIRLLSRRHRCKPNAGLVVYRCDQYGDDGSIKWTSSNGIPMNTCTCRTYHITNRS